MLVQALQPVFPGLRVSVSLVDRDNEWHAVHAVDNVVAFELSHGKGPARGVHNERAMATARAERRTVVAEHAGFVDFIVPVVIEGDVVALLVSGPVSLGRPTSEQLFERWHGLTGRRADATDPEFAQYVAMTLGTLTLDAEHATLYRRLLECFAAVLAGTDVRAYAEEGATLGARLHATRAVDKMWEAARTMVDERIAGQWLSPQMRDELARFGCSRVPEHVAVGLCGGGVGRQDAVKAMLQRDAFQRACVEIARGQSNVVAGRIGHHGVFLLASFPGSRARPESELERLALRVAGLARKRYKLELHLGLCARSGDSSLEQCFEQALGAAERALSEDVPLIRARRRAESTASPVRQLRRGLAATSARRSASLESRFERYIEAVAIECGYRLELARSELAAGFDRAAEALLEAGALEERAYAEMCSALDRSARDARTVADLFEVYRLAVADLARAAEQPVVAAQDRSLRRGLAFIERHFAEPLTRQKVARAAGFAPRYFSQLLKQQRDTTFRDYLLRVRVERGKELLVGTPLSTERIANLCGFSYRPLFHRAFVALVGMTPQAYRHMYSDGQTKRTSRYSSAKPARVR
jgi:AraC-like DNA-binding protein